MIDIILNSVCFNSSLFQGSVRGWERETEKMYLTLEKDNVNEGWGFSCNAADDLEQWGGLLAGKLWGFEILR